MTNEDWRRLKTLKVFFGHQSVGANILEGVRELAAERNEQGPSMVQSDHPSSIAGPAIVEARLGTNGDPFSKIDAFSAVMSRGMGAQGGVALFKLCFTDVDGSTEVDALFAKYRKSISSIKTAYPLLRIVHVTVPLTAGEPTAKAIAKKLLLRSTELDLNRKRNRFNDLLRSEYGRIDPIFDLAAVESTLPDGSRTYDGDKNDPVYTLASEYTDDGSHLNRSGRLNAAAEFVRVLAAAKLDSKRVTQQGPLPDYLPR